MKRSEIIRNGRVEMIERGTVGGTLVDDVGHVCALGGMCFAAKLRHSQIADNGYRYMEDSDYVLPDLVGAIDVLAGVVAPYLPEGLRSADPVTVVTRAFDRMHDAGKDNEFYEYMDRAEKVAEEAEQAGKG